jgi:hypothetical protein
MNIERYEETRWLDLLKDIDGLTELCMKIWRENLDLPQYEYAGKIELDFEEILKLKVNEEAFHSQSISKIRQTLHQGMVKNNQIGRHEFTKDHVIHGSIKKKFKIDKTSVYLNVQSPGNLCGIHIDKYRTHVTRDDFDFSKTITKNIFSGVVFCNDWSVGQVFITGNDTITGWKQGDTYTFPWYMPHGSANAGAENRFLLQFVGELKKND